MSEDEFTPVTISEAYHHIISSRQRVTQKSPKYRRIFDKTLEYCQQHSKITSVTTMESLRDNFKSLGLTDYEIAQINSLFPQSVDEVKGLVTSLNRFDDQTLLKIVQKLHNVADY